MCTVRANSAYCALSLLPRTSSQAACLFGMQLVEPHLSSKLNGLHGMPLPALVRSGTEQLLRTSQLEGQLLEQLFGTGAVAGVPALAGQASGFTQAGVRSCWITYHSSS